MLNFERKKNTKKYDKYHNALWIMTSDPDKQLIFKRKQIIKFRLILVIYWIPIAKKKTKTPNWELLGTCVLH